MATYNRVETQIGHFDLLHPDDEQVRIKFIFRDDAPEDVKQRSSIVVWEAGDGPEDFPSPLAAAEEALTHVKQCYLLPDRVQQWLERVITYLEPLKHEDRLAELDEQIARKEREIEALREDYERTKRAIERQKTEKQEAQCQY